MGLNDLQGVLAHECNQDLARSMFKVQMDMRRRKLITVYAKPTS